MNRYRHASDLLISLADSYYFFQKASNVNLKNILQLIVANYGTKSDSFTIKQIASYLRTNVGRAIFPSNDLFCGDNYLYDIPLESNLNKQYIIMNYEDVYSNYQPNIYESSNYVLQNPGITITQTTNVDFIAVFTSMSLFKYTAGQSVGLGGEVTFSVEDDRQLLAIYQDRPLILSRQEDENTYNITTQTYDHFKSPIFYGLEKLSLNYGIDYFKQLLSGYMVDILENESTVRSYAVPFTLIYPLNNVCVAPKPSYNWSGQKVNLDNCLDYKTISLLDDFNVAPYNDDILTCEGHRSPFVLIYTQTWYDDHPARNFITIQSDNYKTLINTTHSGIKDTGSVSYIKYYPLLYQKAQISAKSFNQFFQLCDTIAIAANNTDRRSESTYKAIVNCADELWFYSGTNDNTVFTLTTPSTLDGETAFKTYIKAIKVVNYAPTDGHGEGPVALYAAGKEIPDITIEVAGISPYEDTWEAGNESEEILISSNGNFTVPFCVVDDSTSGDDYMPFNGYIAIDLKFSK